MTYPPGPDQPHGRFPHGQGHHPPSWPYGQPPMGDVGGGPHGPPPPPKRSRTGLVVGGCVAVVAVVALAVTAFVTPGFLLGDDAGDSEAAALVERIVRGFLDQDEDALNRLVCPGSESAVGAFTEEAEFVQEFELEGPVEEDGDTATATAHAVLADGTERAEGDVTITVANEGGRWCWKDMRD